LPGQAVLQIRRALLEAAVTQDRESAIATRVRVTQYRAAQARILQGRSECQLSSIEIFRDRERVDGEVEADAIRGLLLEQGASAECPRGKRLHLVDRSSLQRCLVRQLRGQEPVHGRLLSILWNIDLHAGPAPENSSRGGHPGLEAAPQNARQALRVGQDLLPIIDSASSGRPRLNRSCAASSAAEALSCGSSISSSARLRAAHGLRTGHERLRATQREHHRGPLVRFRRLALSALQERHG